MNEQAEELTTKEESDEAIQARTPRVPIRALVFFALVALMLVLLTVLLTPYQLGTHTKETIRGMYDQPDNSIQVAYVGASNMLSALSPMTVYDEYGINGYNYASSVQPPFISYYLLKDLMQSQSNSLKLVVMDPSVVLSGGAGSVKSSWAERVLVNMRPSPVKLEALIDFRREYKKKLFESLFSLAKYHSRWNELTSDDFDLLNSVSDTSFSHGEFIRYHANVESPKTANRSSETNALITSELDYTDEELEAMWTDRGKRYLDKLMSYCAENDIDVFFIKTPRVNWKDKQHDSLQHLADTYGVAFLDLSTSDMMERLDLTYTWDFVDDKHPNIRGSEKISHFIGGYITQNYPEIKPIEPTAALEADMNAYAQCREDGNLLLCTDLGEYLKLIDNDRYRVIITTKCEPGAIAQNATVLEGFRNLGLMTDKELSAAKTYIGVVERGNVLVDETGVDDTLSAKGSVQQGQFITERQRLQAGASISPATAITSVAITSSAKPSVSNDGEEDCKQMEGINICVYQADSGELVDASCFDPKQGFQRTSDRLPNNEEA